MKSNIISIILIGFFVIGFFSLESQRVSTAEIKMPDGSFAIAEDNAGYNVTVHPDGSVQTDFIQTDGGGNIIDNGTVIFDPASNELTMWSMNLPAFTLSFQGENITSQLSSLSTFSQDFLLNSTLMVDSNDNGIIGDNGDSFVKFMYLPSDGRYVPEVNSFSNSWDLTVGVVNETLFRTVFTIQEFYGDLEARISLFDAFGTLVSTIMSTLFTQSVALTHDVLSLDVSSLSNASMGSITKLNEHFVFNLSNIYDTPIYAQFVLDNQTQLSGMNLLGAGSEIRNYRIDVNNYFTSAFGVVEQGLDATTQLQYFNNSNFQYIDYFSPELRLTQNGSNFFDFADAHPYIEPELNLTLDGSSFEYAYFQDVIRIDPSTIHFESRNPLFIRNSTVQTQNGNIMNNIFGMFDILMNFDQEGQFISLVFDSVAVGFTSTGEVLLTIGSLRLILNGGLSITEVIMYLFGEPILVVNLELLAGVLHPVIFVVPLNLTVDLTKTITEIQETTDTVTAPGTNITETIVITETKTVSVNVSDTNSTQNTIEFDTPFSGIAVVSSLAFAVMVLNFRKRKK